MSLIPHGFFPRSMMDMDRWMTPFGGHLSTLEAFDPFDELDNMVGRNMQWLNRPDWLTQGFGQSKVPQKYRVTLDCVGYNPNSIKTEWKGNTLTVSAREEERSDTGDFHTKEFKKTYNMPPNCESDKMVSFMTGDGQLCIEVPLKETSKSLNQDLFPQIVDTKDGGKQLSMKFSVPENIAPEHIHVNVKDRCLVVKAEEKQERPDGVSKFHYYKKTTLPENTDFDNLKCNFDDNTHQIMVNAPINLNWKPRNIAIEHNKDNKTSMDNKKAIGGTRQQQQGEGKMIH
jgi:HSP20 family molecular chaperone IbpA